MKIMKTILFLLILSAPVLGYEYEAGRSLGMGKTVLFSSPEASDFLSCPTAIPERGQFLLESGYRNLYELSELNKVYFAAGYRFKNIFGGIGLSQLGKSDYYIEQQLRGVVGAMYDRFVLATIIDGKNVEFGRGLGTYRADAYGVAAGIHFEHGYFSLVANNINRPKLEKNATAENALYEIRGEVIGSSKFSLTGRLALEENKKPMVSVGQYIRIADQLALCWGVVDNPVSYGAGAEFRYHGMIINYSTRYHPVLGFSHNVSIGYNPKLGN
jgi:hypothetical protein